MDRSKIKESVLQELIDLMDSKEVEGLKSKSPKFMKVETNDPEMAQDVVKNALEQEDDEPHALNNIEDLRKLKDMPEMDDSTGMHKMGDKYMKNEDMPDDMDAKDDEEDSDDMQKLLDMYRKLK